MAHTAGSPGSSAIQEVMKAASSPATSFRKGKHPERKRSAEEESGGGKQKARALAHEGGPVAEERCAMCEIMAYVRTYYPMRGAKICRHCAVTMQEVLMAFQAGPLSMPSIPGESATGTSLPEGSHQLFSKLQDPVEQTLFSEYISEEGVKQLAKTSLDPESLPKKLEWLQQQASAIPEKTMGQLTQMELRDLAVKQRKLQAQMFLEHVERALGYSMDEEKELPVHYPPVGKGVYAILSAKLLQDLPIELFTEVAEAMYRLDFHLEFHPHETEPSTVVFVVWASDRTIAKDSAAALVASLTSRGIETGDCGEDTHVFSVKEHGLPGARRQAQRVLSQEYALKIIYGGENAGKVAFTATTMEHIVASVRKGVHAMITLQGVPESASGESQPRNHLALSCFGKKPLVSKVRIAGENHGLKSRLSVTVDRRPPVRFVDGLKADSP